MTAETTADDQILSGADGSPRAGIAPASRGEGRAEEEATPRGVFGKLVRGDGDITGLVAYSIYKQHKLDWLRAFEATQNRRPNETEFASYLCGEGTPRRLATYRHLADATLAGQEPQVAAGTASLARSPPVPDLAPEYNSRAALMERTGLTAGQFAIYALIAVIFVVGVVLALRFTPTAPR